MSRTLIALAGVVVAAMMVGCGAGAEPSEAPSALTTAATSDGQALSTMRLLAQGPFAEAPALLTQLSRLRESLETDDAIGLAQGIEVAQREDGAGFATQAKYELDDSGALSLSVYTVLEGRNVKPEASHTTERAGSPFGTEWVHAAEVFGAHGQDDEQVSRAAGFLSLMQLSRVPLKVAARFAARYGFVYRVEPEVFFGQDAPGVAAFNALVFDRRRSRAAVEGVAAGRPLRRKLGAGAGAWRVGWVGPC